MVSQRTHCPHFYEHHVNKDRACVHIDKKTHNELLLAVPGVAARQFHKNVFS